MRCSSHIVILSVLLAATSSTPVAPPGDGPLADLIDEELMEAVLSPAVPRQVSSGDHGPSGEQAFTTNASPSTSTSTPGDIDILDERGRVKPHLYPRQSSATSDSTSVSSTIDFTTGSSTKYCPNPPSTIRVTVISTATMIMNVATLWPGKWQHAGLETPTTDASPSLTPGPLLQQQHEAWKRAVRIIPMHDAAGDVVSEEDEREADEILFYNPGGIMLAPTPPLPTDEASASVAIAAPTQNNSGCTTTMLGRISNPCRAKGNLTVHTATTTVYSSIECNGCTSVKVIQPMWGCPFMSVESSEIAATPSTWTSTVCAAATAVTNLTEAGAEASISAKDTAQLLLSPTASAFEASTLAETGVEETSSATGTA